MVRRASVSALAGLACALAVGCGDEAKPTSKPAKAKSPPAKVSLERFLLKEGEEPGFKPIDAPRTDTGVEAFVQGGDTPDDAAQRLRRDGFIAFTFQPVVVDGGNAGVTNVVLFESAQGARDWMGWETSDEGIHGQIPDTKIHRFTLGDIPGANGWTGTDLHGNRIGQVYWVQGRCMILIANEGEGDFVKPLSTGAKAIYERTNGACP
jgi:hypothetical protein